MTRRVQAKAQKSQEPIITSDAFYRTFHLKCGTRKGAGFTIDVDGRQYLVTAAHLVRHFQNGAVLEMLHGGKWKPIAAVAVGYAPPQIDVAVLALKLRLTLPEFRFEPGMAGLTSAQDVYCLGFPLGDWGVEGASTQKFPTAFVKKATVSYLPDGASPVRCLYLDGRSNPGFSGGPVVFRNSGPGETQGGMQGEMQGGMKVAAVVSAFQYENEPVYMGSASIHLSAQGNPGLILSYDIQHALDLINLNPIGFQLID